MVRIDDVIEQLQRQHPDADVDLVRRAYIFSGQAHRGQTRRNGEPYLVHPLEVAHIASELGLDTASVCAGLLHDTVEDTVATVEDIREQFGPDIAELVDGLTKLEKVHFSNAFEAAAESFRKMIVAMSRDIRVILVKLCDRLHNMRTLTFMPADKQQRIAQETMDIFAPLANRLGMHSVKSELEDLSFKYLFSDEYKSLAEQIQRTRAERDAYTERVCAEIRLLLAAEQVEGDVSGRPKHLWSIRQKLKPTGGDLSSLYDVLAFRVVVGNKGQCYEALGLVHARWKPIPGRFKDYVGMPKPNGYQSLHTAVVGPENERIEIQIRTQEMHRIAELGVAAHWSYKDRQYGRLNTNAINDEVRFASLRQLVELQRELPDSADFMESVKVSLFDDEVYVFSPQGEPKAFPRGATPVDFAYSIHTTLGHECVGAKVNGRVVPLRYQMRNGDKVEILRSAGSKPKADWTKFVKTAGAAAKIRAYLRKEANERHAQIGRELLDRELRRYGGNLGKLRRSGALEKALEGFKYRTEHDLCVALGYDRVQPATVVAALLPKNLLEAGPREEAPESAVKRMIRKVMPSRSHGGIVVDGVDGVAVHFPKCCGAIKGDDISGFVTRGRGVTVHRRDCPRVLDYDIARRVEVRWDIAAHTARPVDLRVLSADVPGLLAGVSRAIHDAGANITAVNCKITGDGRAVNNFTVQVADLEQLVKVRRSIERIDGVHSVERMLT